MSKKKPLSNIQKQEALKKRLLENAKKRKETQKIKAIESKHKKTIIIDISDLKLLQKMGLPAKQAIEKIYQSSYKKENLVDLLKNAGYSFIEVTQAISKTKSASLYATDIAQWARLNKMPSETVAKILLSLGVRSKSKLLLSLHFASPFVGNSYYSKKNWNYISKGLSAIGFSIKNRARVFMSLDGYRQRVTSFLINNNYSEKQALELYNKFAKEERVESLKKYDKR